MGLPPADGVAVTKMSAGNPSVLFPVTVKVAGDTVEVDVVSPVSVTFIAVSTVYSPGGTLAVMEYGPTGWLANVPIEMGLPPATGVAVTTMSAGNPSVLLPATVRMAGATVDDDLASLASVVPVDTCTV
jgi:hypothetical protein